MIKLNDKPIRQLNPMRQLNKAFAGIAMALTLTACSSLTSPNSPDVVYSETASASRTLLVPPDLTNVSNAEQFVLPGTANAAITRNTLLPQLDSVRFVREGGQSWLEFLEPPEELWMHILAFLRKENYDIDQTEPVSGLVVSQWRAPDADGGSSLLRNLVGGDEQFTRVALRLERAAVGSRLFARSQAASTDVVEAAAGVSDLAWPASSHSPENTSAMLVRLLAFLGVEQQKARGILGDEQAAAVLENAVVQRNAAGSEILLNRGFQASFQHIEAALLSLNYTVLSSDESVGRIEFSDAQMPLLIRLSPVHVSAVVVSVSDIDGRRLAGEREQQLLMALAGEIS